MSPRTTAILGVVALILGAFVYLYEIEGGADREAAREAEKRLYPAVTAEAVESVELTTSDGAPARFERNEGAWRVVAPVEGRADAMALDAIASALAQLARSGEVRAAPDDLAQFDLGDRAQVVRFRAGGTDHVLRIGRATPVGGNVYVAADDGAAVVYVESFRLNALRRSLSELRDRRIVAIEGETLVALSLDWSSGGAGGASGAGDADGSAGTDRIELVRGAGGAWRIRAPFAARADQQTVREVVSNLQFLQASGFVDERSREVDSALQETVLAIRWTEGEEDPAGDSANAGSTPAPGAAAGRAGWLRIAGLFDGSRLVESEGRLYTIASERLEDFPRALERYRDKQLVELDPDALERIELAYRDAPPIVLTRGESGWRAADRALEADGVAALVDALAMLRAEAIVADAMGEAERAGLGLAPPALRIRLQAEEGPGEDEPPAAAGGPAAAGDDAGRGEVILELGRLDPERGLFARRADEPIVYTLAASLADALPLDRATFEARFARPAAEAAAAKAEGTEANAAKAEGAEAAAVEERAEETATDTATDTAEGTSEAP